MTATDDLMEAIMAGVQIGLTRAAQRVAKVARAKAPVRNIFNGANYNIRFKSITEIEEQRDIKARLGLAPDLLRGKKRARTTLGRTLGTATGSGSPISIREYTRHPASRWRQRRISIAQEHLAEYNAEMTRRKDKNYVPQRTVLSRRGASEVRSGRAKYVTWGHAYIGGRLRDSIKASPATVSGNRAEAWVIASAPYAKYQEFGTRHNAAHPFLRPAAEESRDAVVGDVADAIRDALRTGFGNEIEIVVRL